MKKWPLTKPTCLHVQFISPTLLIINLFHILYFAGSELFHFIQYLALDGNENRGFTSSEREEGGVSRESEKRFNLDSHRRNITHGWSSLFYLSLVGALLLMFRCRNQQVTIKRFSFLSKMMAHNWCRFWYSCWCWSWFWCWAYAAYNTEYEQMTIWWC